MKVTAIITCAGKGLRAGFNKNKLLIPFDGKTVLERTLAAFYKNKRVSRVIVTSSEEDFSEIKKLCGDAEVVIGGNTRTESVENALKVADGDIILIHDGARPFVTQKVIDDCIDTAIEYGGAVPVVSQRDTVVKAETIDGEFGYVGKSNLYCVQTPQGFAADKIKKAFSLRNGLSYNDDGDLYKHYITIPRLFEGDPKNVKLTFKEDFEKLYFSENVRTGVGFDCHKLVSGRKLIIGGITVPHEKGLLGHSDADVLTHALMDALLSAAGLRDIGYYFPDDDPAYLNADSVILLKKVVAMISEKGYVPESFSAVIMAEKPKLKTFIPFMADNLCRVLGIPVDNAGISATTLEGLGFVGREEGICVSCSVVLKNRNRAL